MMAATIEEALREAIAETASDADAGVMETTETRAVARDLGVFPTRFAWRNPAPAGKITIDGSRAHRGIVVVDGARDQFTVEVCYAPPRMEGGKVVGRPSFFPTGRVIARCGTCGHVGETWFDEVLRKKCCGEIREIIERVPAPEPPTLPVGKHPGDGTGLPSLWAVFDVRRAPTDRTPETAFEEQIVRRLAEQHLTVRPAAVTWELGVAPRAFVLEGRPAWETGKATRSQLEGVGMPWTRRIFRPRVGIV